jgi:peptide/nickel transport system ATP-binding protein
MTRPLLEASRLSKRFGKRHKTVFAVDGVSLAIAPGASLGLVGESGSGKTTLGRLLAALDFPSAGEVCFQGTPLAALGKAEFRNFRRHVQYVFQDPVSALNPRKTVRVILASALTGVAHVVPKERAQRANELLNTVGLGENLLDRYPHELSGGQAQRVVIARALAVQPALLILDEPVSALDVSVQAQLLQLLRELRAEFNLAYLFISHDLAVVEQLCEYVLVMHNGQIVEQGEREPLFKAPRHPYTQTLLAAVPVPGKKLRGVFEEDFSGQSFRKTPSSGKP